MFPVLILKFSKASLVIIHRYFTFIICRAPAMPSDTIKVRVLLYHYWKRSLSTRNTVKPINDVEGILRFELVPNGYVISIKFYCEQLNRVYEKLKGEYSILIN